MGDGVWRPVSVTRLPGHTRVQVFPCLEQCGSGIYRFQSFIATNVNLLDPAPGQFYGHKGQVRYINGRGEVYETNIIYPVRVLFSPDGKQLLPDGKQQVNCIWEQVLFRKLHKVEWLFE